MTKHRVLVLFMTAAMLAAITLVSNAGDKCADAPKCTKVAAKPAKPPVSLLARAKWSYSIDGGKTFSATVPTIPAEVKAAVVVRAEFTAEKANFKVLELSAQYPSYKLNGKAVTGPLPGMRYKTIPITRVDLLKDGENVLTASTNIANVSHGKHKAKPKKPNLPKFTLSALKPEHIKFQTGPILGAVGKEYFSITCRTNMPAKVTVRSSGTSREIIPSAQSKTGLIHRFRMPASKRYAGKAYVLTANSDGGSAKVIIKAPALLGKQTGKLRIAAMGDSRTHPHDWAKVAAAAVKAKPDLVVFSGDMVTNGLNDWEWDEQYFRPAAELFATTPYYAVIGNHENNAPVYNELFYTPSKDGKARNWSQTVGSVLLIGIDGREDFSAASKNIKWLEQQLAGAKEVKFIFFFNHYPAWTSGGHGAMTAEGLPREKPMREAQTVIMPLLEKYKATAMFAGHDHIYERSEPTGGVTHIVAGGAGAPLYSKVENAEKQNPHSKVFAAKLHYCLLEVDGDTCSLKVLTPAGEEIDSRTWKARNAK